MTHIMRAAKVTAFVGMAVIPAGAAGQTIQAGALEPDSSACLANIPAKLMKRAGVYLTVDVVLPSDSTAKLATDPALALSRAMAIYARELLGAPAGQAPAAEPVVTWRDAEGTMRITVHRAGKLSFVDMNPKKSGIGGAAMLLESGLTSAINAGFKFEWPAGVTTDSIVFDIQLDSEGAEKGVTPTPREGQEPLFTVMTPWETDQVRQIRPPRISYPPAVTSPGMEGYIHLNFVVDTTGRVVISTVRDIWPIGRPRLTGEMGRYYDAFLKAVREGLPTARFAPARYGGCPVQMWVRQSFEFKPKSPPQ